MKSELVENYEKLMDLYADIKRDIRLKDPIFYERWKAGGFLVDEDIMSMYPHLGQFPEFSDDYEEEDEDEDEQSGEEIE
jgi:hypothetical protein